jgi:hypothetical protein
MPEHVAQHGIRLKRMPPVRVEVIEPGALKIMAALLAGVATFDTVCRVAQAMPDEVMQHLCALHTTRTLEFV